jgi:LuxR family transcriptional regulator, regulator of acetate metabolism
MTTTSIMAVSGPVEIATVLVRLSDLGPPSELRNQSPMLAAGALGFERVLLTGINAGALEADALHVASGPKADTVLKRLREAPVALDYPLIEGEIMRRRRAQVVRSSDGGTSQNHAFADVLGWTEYVVAPIVLDGSVIGFFHADRKPSGRPLEDGDAVWLSSFALCFGLVYERAVLRHRLRVQRQEMREVASWADARTSELGDRSITLAEDGAADTGGATVRTSGVGENALRDLLTRRELEVLRLMVRGETNGGIAKDLVVAEGTVKFHVKNILRKLHVSNRAEATSRYLRLTLNHGQGQGGGGLG